jgi:hypothetical protein
MRRTHHELLLCAVVAATCLGGCKADEACTDAAPIVPGCGVSDGERAMLLGQPFSAVEQAFGSPSRQRDLGTLGTSFAYPEDGISGFRTDGAVTIITVGPGFEGATAGGVGLGSDTADIDSEFGAGSVDAVLGAHWHRDLGIGFEIEGDEITSIQLFEPGT